MHDFLSEPIRLAVGRFPDVGGRVNLVWGVPALLTIVGVVLLFLLVVPIICAVFVYTDARKRGLSAGLWALFAFFTTVIGLIVYLLARPPRAESCARCGQPLRNGFVVCPACGAKSSHACGSCGRRLEPGWSVCPYCGAKALEAPQEQTLKAASVPVAFPRVSGMAAASLALTMLGPIVGPLLLMIALRFGFAGFFVLPFWPILTIVGLVAVPIGLALAIAALVSIHRGRGTLTGAWMAWIALALNGLLVLLLVGGAAMALLALVAPALR